MFERFTRKARRAVFFALYKARMFGSPYIETEHLLLGVLHENPTLSAQFFQPPTTPESLREQIRLNRPFQKEIPTSVKLKASNECKRAFAYAAEEAERLNHHFISTGHLVLGLLREGNNLGANLLTQHGVTASAVHKDVEDHPD
jgi:ATP-dependent Clp protease ATP-binding subunit ClpC